MIERESAGQSEARTGRQAARAAADAGADEPVAAAPVDPREDRSRGLVGRARAVVAVADVVPHPRLALPGHADVVAAKQEAGRLRDVVEVEARDPLVPRQVVLRRQEEPVDAFDPSVLAVRIAEVAELRPCAAVLEDA